MGLKYIYAGFSKTGTKTIAEVFRTLNFVVHDYEETALYNVDNWLKFLNPETGRAEKIKILRDTFENVDVVTDAPHFFFWEELMEAFPEAKCIIWKRNSASWFKSFKNQTESSLDLVSVFGKRIHPKIAEAFVLPFSFMFCPTLYKISTMGVYVQTLINGYSATTPAVHLSEIDCIRNYNQHVNYLIAKLGATDKLLVLNEINCGWQVICDFCKVPVPVGIDWPHKNKNAKINDELFASDSALSKKMKKEMMMRLSFIPVILLLVLVGISL